MVNKPGIKYTLTQEQRINVALMFEEMTPSSTREELLVRLGLKKSSR